MTYEQQIEHKIKTSSEWWALSVLLTIISIIVVSFAHGMDNLYLGTFGFYVFVASLFTFFISSRYSRSYKVLQTVVRKKLEAKAKDIAQTKLVVASNTDIPFATRYDDIVYVWEQDLITDNEYTNAIQQLKRGSWDNS